MFYSEHGGRTKAVAGSCPRGDGLGGGGGAGGKGQYVKPNKSFTTI